MAVGANARKFILQSEEGRPVHRRMLNGATALQAGEMVTLSSNTLAEVADSNTVGAVGICAQDIAASSYGTVYVAGMFKGSAASGVNFALGDAVYNASASTLDAGTAGDVPVGKVVHTDPAEAGTVWFELWSIILNEIDAKS